MQRDAKTFFCTKDCPDFCEFTIDERDGKRTIVPRLHVTGGAPFVCKKLSGFLERESVHQDAFGFPCGEKTCLSPADAIDAITGFLRQCTPSCKILYLRGSGSLAAFMPAWDHLFAHLGAVFVEGNPCDETGIVAHEKDFGVCVNPPIENLAEAETILLFGKNPKVTSPHFYAYLKQLKKQGKRLILIDPVLNETAPLCDSYIRINPASDGFLAAALLAARGLFDGNPDELRAKAGVSVADFTLLTNALQNGTTGIITGMGVQRYTNGMNLVQWLNRLAVDTGNEHLLYYSRPSKNGMPKLQKPEVDIVNIGDLPELFRKKAFDAIVIIGANPVVTYPEAGEWAKALQSTRSVVVDTNLSETACNAQYFLRVGGMFCQRDAGGSYFFRNRSGFRSGTVRMPELSDADTACMIADLMGVPTREAVQELYAEFDAFTQPDDEPRNYVRHDLALKEPYTENGFRLMTGSNYHSLNSQLQEQVPDDQRGVYINPADAVRLGITDGDAVELRNALGAVKTRARISTKTAEGVLFLYKSLLLDEGTANTIHPSRLTDSGNGLAYYDTFVDIAKV